MAGLILSQRRVRMYAAFFHERRYIGRMLTGRAYIFWGENQGK